MELPDTVIVVLAAANRHLTVFEIAEECQAYLEGMVSYFDVKQVCFHLYREEQLWLRGVDPIAFEWRER